MWLPLLALLFLSHIKRTIIHLVWCRRGLNPQRWNFTDSESFVETGQLLHTTEVFEYFWFIFDLRQAYK